MTRRTRFLASAIRNLEEIVAYISDASGSADIGEKFTLQLRQQCSRLATLPGTIGRARPELGEALRSFPYRDYLVVFRYDEAEVTIVAILRASRDVTAYFRDDAGG